MSPRTRDQSWILKEREAFSLGIVKHRRNTEFMYLVSRRSRSVEMSPLVKMQLSTSLRRTLQKRSKMRSLKLQEDQVQKQKSLYLNIMVSWSLKSLKILPMKCFQARDDLLGPVSSCRKWRSMVLQMEPSEKARDQNHFPVTWHFYQT